MQIDKVFYPVTSLGYGSRVGIWTVGCPHKCNNCSNPELWAVDVSKDIDIENILVFIKNIQGKVDGVTISGGEPFFQFDELIKLLKAINNLGIEDILVYTGYTKSEILKKEYMEAFDYIAALVDGRYNDLLNYNKGLMGSDNQKLYLFKEKFADRYEGFCNKKRKTQNIICNHTIHSFGIPIKK